MEPLVIYHGQCMDGFAAALAAQDALPGADLFAGFYGKEPPGWGALDGRRVILADFSYPRGIMERIATLASELYVFDHHQTAEEALRGFAPKNGVVVFDMARSGAGITWDELHPGASRPWLIDYVEDRDLWRYALPLSREINAYIGTLPYEQPSDLDAWRDVAKLDTATVEMLGRGAWAFLQGWAKAASRSVTRPVDIELPDGRVFPAIPVANCPQKGGSEVMEIVAAGQPFAAYWSRRPDGRINYGLRSAPGGVDVSAIAKLYGGGGHKHASGFVADRVLWEG